MNTDTNSVREWIAALRQLGAREVDQYEQKLVSFGPNDQKVFEMLSEARTALMFLRNGWSVTMRDRPDLYLEYNKHPLYAEIKHFNVKGTDKRDGEAMAAAGEFEFVQVGSVFDDEGQHPWQQMCSRAIHKVPQYADGYPNLLVFVSYGDCLDLMLESAANEFDDEVRKGGEASPLRKLSGMMLLSPNYGPSTGWSNVFFRPMRYSLHPLKYELIESLARLQVA